ncbi:MAG: MBL fold metallo-hydrolase [Bacillota bacterium]|nr:MBL fold metallo-hydrolase [Bacillota bacterium]
MKVTLLLENNSLYCSYLYAEHGFSAWIEDEDIKVLYDFGFSDKFIRNAEALGIDLRLADYVILSHGHKDHFGGLKYLIKYYKDMAMAKKPIMLLSHEDIFQKRYNFTKNGPSGLDVSREIMEQHFDVRITPAPLWLTSNLCYMGIIESTNNFERQVPQAPKKLKDGIWMDDLVDEDTQLAYRHKNGNEVSIVAGCAHYGICNIIESAKRLTGAEKVNTYVGGSHLRIDEVTQEQVDLTCEYIKSERIKNFYICHDTDLHCKQALWNATPSKEAGVGLKVEIE